MQLLSVVGIEMLGFYCKNFGVYLIDNTGIPSPGWLTSHVR
jgi:hypothetical protein